MRQFWVALLFPFVALIVYSLVRWFTWVIFPLVPRSWRRALYTDGSTGEYRPPGGGRRG